ncbi:MAG TPA: peptide ABC transporter substrate-binding protein [Candidatus Sulfomarinibacteraceae bacterium]|nr:peptide ABC transporter substrate-binding protein [Candidatus Sulfomarinibacteraceae bacterium]
MVAALIPRRSRRLAVLGSLGALVLVATVAAGGAAWGSASLAAGRDEATILLGEPTTLDPAHQGDIGSAAYSAQLYESLTAFDATLTLRPALARSWDISDDGTRVVFHLRDGLRFSDGTPLGAADVVGSWLRIIDPAQPSQLASLLLDVRGAAAYLSGATSDPADVGLRADGRDVIVDLVGPGSDFPAAVASPTFGIVPASVWRDGDAIDGGTSVGSGAYVLTDVTPSEFTLVANPAYWAGPAPIRTMHLLTGIGGRSPVAAFEDGDIDYTGIGSYDATWIRYDPDLGPHLRVVPSLSLAYVGFTTTKPPFDDVRVRQAFGAAVDWRRIVELGTVAGGQVPADSMVPPGIPGGGDRNWLPTHDPDAARALLERAGYPGGHGFPDVAFAIGGLAYAEAIAADLERELGISIRLEELDGHFPRLHQDPPQMWSLGWVADYPGANDFLGVLLGTGSSNNYGRWSSPTFDAAISDALATRDPELALAAFERALEVVHSDVPVIPIAYGDGWALARDGLLGAGRNGLGILRLAGLAWR